MTRARRTLRSSSSSSAGTRAAQAAVARSAQQTAVVRIEAPFVDRGRSGIVYAEPLRAEGRSAYNRPAPRLARDPAMSGRTRFPAVFWIANLIEILERFAYYGIYFGFGIYMESLGYSRAQL